MSPRRPKGWDRVWEGLAANAGLKLISVAIALLLWGIVLGSRNVEATKELPVEVITSPDVVPANDIPEKIAFKLSGPKAFLRAVLDRREEPIRVNLTGAKPGLVTYRFFSDNIRVPIGVKVLSINPTAILVKLEYLRRKDVPVRLELRGQPPEGYRVVSAEIKPELVRIKGAETRVDAISEVSTLPLDLANLRQDVTKEMQLDLTRYGVHLDGEAPQAEVRIEAIAANFRVKNVDIRVLSSYKSRVEEKSVTVLVRASPLEMRQLDRSRVYAIVDLGDQPRGKYTESVKVSLPENVGLVRVIPEKVHVTLY